MNTVLELQKMKNVEELQMSKKKVKPSWTAITTLVGTSTISNHC